MDFSLPPRRRHQQRQEHFISVFKKSVSLLIRFDQCLLNLWTSQSQQCHFITTTTPLAKHSFSLMNATRKRIDIFCFSIFISLLLTSHVVVAADHHAQHIPQPAPSYDNSSSTTNSSDDSDSVASTTLSGIRRSRYAGASTGHHAVASSFTLRPEFFLIPVGGVIHLFPRYGYLSLSMKVIAKNNSNLSAASSSVAIRNDSWIFLEPVNNVIESSTLKTEETSFSPVNDSDSLPFHNLFHFDLCEDIRTLMEAYFKNFTIEGLDKSWQAFAGGWRAASIARNFGLNQSYVEGDFRYVLVKVLLVRGVGRVEPFGNATASHVFKSNFFRFIPDNDLSTYEFFNSVGTHYIHSYIAGNAMYQVFVYDQDGFSAVKQRLFSDGIKDNTTAGSAHLILESLMRWMINMGKVNILNAEPNVTENVRKALVMQVSSPTAIVASNLLKLHDNASLVKEIETALSSQPNGLLGIDLRGIQFLFSDPVQRAGFEKALKHTMQLWEINFLY